MLKQIPFGISDFKKLTELECYFVDKSLLIQDVLNSKAEVTVLPRPRRFGKTLNMTMLRYFLEESEEDNAKLFSDLEIASVPECMEQQGKHPVIFLTLKDLKEESWDDFLESVGLLLSDLYRDCHLLLNTGSLDSVDREYIEKVTHGRCTKIELKRSLYSLSRFIFKITGKKPFILIDEYDTPIHSGYLNGYYKEVINFFQGFLGKALKDNPNLKKSVITGILRVSKESIFSDLNNPDVCTLLEKQYSDRFGFLEEEVKEMLRYYSMDDCFETVKKWYDGYLFGEETIYNPWSVISFVHKGEKKPQPFWLNTSSNQLIHDIISERMIALEKDLEVLLSGGKITCVINQQVSFPSLKQDEQSIWSFLLFCGYLKASNYRKRDVEDLYDLEIPNMEVRALFQETVVRWINDAMGYNVGRKIREDLSEGNIEEFLEELKELVKVTLSVHDTKGKEPEIAYHMLVLGMVAHVSVEYHIRSNRETGIGRYDVVLEPKDPKQQGYVFEFKQANGKSDKAVKKAKQEALDQIKTKQYTTDMHARGIKEIVCVAMVFKGKKLHTDFEQFKADYSS